MNGLLEAFGRAAARSNDPQLFKIGYALIAVTGLILLVAVALKFAEHALHPQPLKTARPHFFSTFGMTLAVLLLFPFWVNSIGQVEMDSGSPMPRYICFGVGAAMLACGFALHLWAKHSIRLMWSDGIEIKRSHTLVTTGAYAWARHPMYAGLLMWCWGGCLMMFNGIAFALTSFLILPLMIRRAKDEEKALTQAHPDYLLYQQNVRMLTPTLRGGVALAVKLIGIGILGFCILDSIAKIATLWGRTPVPDACDRMTAPTAVFLTFLHLFLGYSLQPEKVAFSYRSKSGMMLVFWGLSFLWHPFYYMTFLMLAMYAYGLRFNCPCMIVYNKYKRCPCFDLFAALFRKPGKGCGI